VLRCSLWHSFTNSPMVLMLVLLSSVHHRLPPGWIDLHTLAQHFDKLPARDALIKALTQKGFAAAR
jgi:hypothetical protein